jgi:signal transduction histidine kinase
LNHRLDLWNSVAGLPYASTQATGEAHGRPAPSRAELEGPCRGSPAELERGRSASPRENAKPILVIVDDEADVLRSVQNLLRLDYQVATFQHGAEAIKFLEKTPRVHVILSDQRMPGMSGVEVLQHAMAIRPETTRLLFTAYADIRAVVDAINEGNVFRYLAKPCDPELLAIVVRQAVEHHDLIVEKNTLLAELQNSNERLLEANRVKGAFIEVASHELNTPLTVVLGMIDLWKMSQGQTASPQERQWVDRIAAAAARLSRTVERMLKLVRNREFTQSLEVEPLELRPTIERVVEELSLYLGLRQQTVTIDIDPEAGSFEADPTKIADVLINLLANAIKFTPDGGTIKVRASVEARAPDEIRVEVSDQGLGVAPGDQQHLFEPFFTGFDTLRHSSGEYQYGKRGIGLGLCLVKTFVQLHGGRVEVSSTPGVGSTFAFVLPRSQSSRVRD